MTPFSAIGFLACLDGPSAREISRKTRRGEQISNMGWRSGGVFRPCRSAHRYRNASCRRARSSTCRHAQNTASLCARNTICRHDRNTACLCAGPQSDPRPSGSGMFGIHSISETPYLAPHSPNSRASAPLRSRLRSEPRAAASDVSIRRQTHRPKPSSTLPGDPQ
jgi:hypothetical protein